jgi:hypothetical protein
MENKTYTENRLLDHSVTRPDDEGHSPFRIAQVIGLCPSSIVSEIQMKMDTTFLKLDLFPFSGEKGWRRYTVRPVT